jgi:hypothetical protein
MTETNQHLQSTCAKGRWWLAGHPDHVLPGEITYGTCSGAEVHLFGSFYGPSDQSFLKSRPTLLGVTVKGERITLFNCMPAGATFHIGGGGGASSVIKSCFGIVGSHYDTPDSICISRIKVAFNGLFEWTATSGVKLDIQEEPGKFQLSYQSPSILSLGSFHTGKGSLEFTATLDPNVGLHRISESCVFVLDCDNASSYAKIEDDIQTFQLLLTLATQRPAYALQIIGRDPTVSDNKDLIFIRKLGVTEKDLERQHTLQMLFCLEDIREDIQNFIRNLVEKRNQLRPCFDLYFSTVYDNSHSPRVDVLLLAQALEGIHRITVGGRYVDDKIWRFAKLGG